MKRKVVLPRQFEQQKEVWVLQAVTWERKKVYFLRSHMMDPNNYGEKNTAVTVICKPKFAGQQCLTQSISLPFCFSEG